jgi:hypothetical protein
MTDDFDVEAALEGARTTQHFVVAEAPATRIERAMMGLGSLIEPLRQIVTDPDLMPARIDEASPEQRKMITDLRAVLQALEEPLRIRIRSIDEAVKIAHAKTGAKSFPVEGGKAIGVTPPQQDYVTEDEALRKALLALIPEGSITKDEIDRALTPLVYFKPDHRFLNWLRDNRGEKIKAAIEKHRRKPELDPARMKVTWPK